MCLWHKTHYSPKTKQSFTGEQVFAVSIIFFQSAWNHQAFKALKHEKQDEKHKEVIISNNMHKSGTLINRTEVCRLWPPCNFGLIG